MKIAGILRFVTGVLVGYCLVQGFTFVNANYLWAIFYKG
jgi:hypothetical protein